MYFAHIRDKLRFELELPCFATTFVLKIEKRCRVGTLASWQGQNLARSAVLQTCFGSGLKSLGLFLHLFFLYVMSLCTGLVLCSFMQLLISPWKLFHRSCSDCYQLACLVQPTIEVATSSKKKMQGSLSGSIPRCHCCPSDPTFRRGKYQIPAIPSQLLQKGRRK